MKKILILAFVSAFFICTAVLAQAKEFKGGKMSVQVSDTWIAEYSKENNQVKIISPEGDYVLGIQVLDYSRTAKDFAKTMSTMMEGTFPKRVGADENHYFFFAPFDKDNADKESSDILIVDIITNDNKTLVLVEAGSAIPYLKEVDLVWNSIQSSDSDEQAILEIIFKK